MDDPKGKRSRPTQRDYAPKAERPTREREQKEPPGERQREKQDDHPLNEDPDFPPRR